MLQLDLIRIFSEKGIENPVTFLKKNGFSYYTARNIINNKITGISFKHLEQLCLLLNCSIDDLFGWDLDDTTGKYKNHPFQKLKRDKPKENIYNKLKELPLDKLTEVRTFIDRLSENKP